MRGKVYEVDPKTGEILREIQLEGEDQEYLRRRNLY